MNDAAVALVESNTSQSSAKGNNYSKTAVQRAGKDLLTEELAQKRPARFRECMGVLSHWRACHISALNNLTRLLTKLSELEDRNAIVVARLKRTPSIIAKLHRNPKMNLDRMQDIAGCRSIVRNPKRVEKVKRRLKRLHSLKERNYIESPKEDGYRGIHLIGKDKNPSDGKYYQVEIQLRTKLQHAWATAVEIVDLFTNQTLKSNIGKEIWKDFFRHTANEFAKLEGTPHSEQLYSQSELPALVNQLDIYKKFSAFQLTLNFIEKEVSKNEHSYCLIKIDTKSLSGEVHLFQKEKFQTATTKYLESEKESAGKNSLVVALVNVASVDNLKEAYPNYFADSSYFIRNLKLVDNPEPSWIVRKLISWLGSTGLAGRQPKVSNR